MGLTTLESISFSLVKIVTGVEATLFFFRAVVRRQDPVSVVYVYCLLSPARAKADGYLSYPTGATNGSSSSRDADVTNGISQSAPTVAVFSSAKGVING